MKTVDLGKTGLKISELGFGGIPIIPLSLDDGIAVVRHCYDLGITFFDTANMYGDSEKKIGEALVQVREKVVLATKTLEKNADGAAKHIELSLENLKTDYIDLYQLHNVSKEDEMKQVMGPGGAFEALKQARNEQRIKFIGFSSHDIKTAIKMCRTNLFSTVQFPFNFIECDPADELFKIAYELGMGIIAMKPLGGGLLERAELCFKFLQSHPYVIPIPGIQSKAEIDEIVSFYSSPSPLSDEDQKEMQSIRSELGSKFCHRCGYCIPCEQGVNIPEVMAVRPMVRRLSPALAIMLSEAAVETVDNCSDCGDCLDKCPYSLPIPETLRENQSYFKDFVVRHSQS